MFLALFTRTDTPMKKGKNKVESQTLRLPIETNDVIAMGEEALALYAQEMFRKLIGDKPRTTLTDFRLEDTYDGDMHFGNYCQGWERSKIAFA